MNLRVCGWVVLVSDQGLFFTFDTRNGELVRINETAVQVLEMADGTRPAGVIVAEISGRLGREKAEKCRKWLEKAIEAGLLVESAEHGADAAGPGHDAAGLHAIAKRLMAGDEVRKAYLLQKRAVGLAGVVAEHWHQLGELAHIVGRREESRAAYERYLECRPDDPEVTHLLRALRDEPPPERAPDDYVRHLYRQFSAYYETSMCGDLRYAAPDHLLGAIKKSLAGRAAGLVAADLGCGTGLFGTRLRPMCRRLVGVDLSHEMLEKSSETKAYDKLDCAEITGWLAQEPRERFDLIAFCDTLIYFGDLRRVLSGCANHLLPGGLVAFTLEKGEQVPIKLSDSGRFQHHKNHVRDAARDAGLDVVYRAEETLRLEYGRAVTGLVTVLRQPG